MGSSVRRVAVALAAALALFAGLIGGAGPAGATNVGDATALDTAFANSAESTITLTADITLTCVEGALVRASVTPLTVDGQGQFSITQSCPDQAHMVVAGNLNLVGLGLVGGGTGVVIAGDLALTDSSITGLTHTSNASGIVAGGSVTLTRSSIDGLSAPNTIALVIAGETVLQQSAITNLSATDEACAVLMSGNLSITDSLIGPVAGQNVACGVFAAATTLSIDRSTIANITSPVSSTSILSGSETATITNSTISNNSGPIVMGADSLAFVYSDIFELGGNVSITAVEVPEITLPDDAPEGLSVAEPDLSLAALDVGAQQVDAQIIVEGETSFFGTVVARPLAGAVNCDVLPPPTSNGYNFSDDATCGFTGTGDRQSAGDPMVGPLADNGGPTPTRLPLTGSPLLDFIPLAACQSDGAAGITTDQRSLVRPSGAGCEIGSVEVQLVVRFTG